jgi:excisionase family DNA binding protein
VLVGSCCPVFSRRRFSDLRRERGMDVSRDGFTEPLLTTAEAAALLAVRTSWVYEAVRAGRLPCVRVGRHVRFLRSDLEAWVAGQREQPRV